MALSRVSPRPAESGLQTGGPSRPHLVRWRLPFLAASITALLAALWAGLDRLGWALPPPTPDLPALHGPLMVSGFLGTLIGLERAVAVRCPWAYLAPLLAGAGGLALVMGAPPPQAAALTVLAALGLIATFVVLYRLQPDLATATMGVGAVLWLGAGVLQILGAPVPRTVPWWAGFLLLTIVGERLELSRLARLTWTGLLTYLGSAGLFLAGLLTSVLALGPGMRLAGAALVAFAVWLLRYDVVRRTVRRPGLPRFIGTSLLVGYLWLGAAGILWARFGGQTGGLGDDAMLHALFLGFVVTLIFAHAPVIFPAVLGTPLAFHPRSYASLVLLQGSLLLRVGGDLAGWIPGRQWGGLLNVAALLFFVATTLLSVASPPPDRRS